MEKSKEAIFSRLGNRWLIKPAFLRDVYSLMRNDIRFASLRHDDGIRFSKVADYLKVSYGLEIKPRQLKYLVLLIKNRK